MKQHRYFTQQFSGLSAGKLARRERFMRKVAGRSRQMRSSLRRGKRLNAARARG